MSKNAAIYQRAHEQRELCRDWLKFLMTQSSEKLATKEELREEAIRRWGVSKSAFDFGWIAAIEDTGNHHWYEPKRQPNHDWARSVMQLSYKRNS
jgi:hypothetical protein